ncbi:MAG: acyl-ACP thioesterase domain-containing protein [Bacteroidota bacterium]
MPTPLVWTEAFRVRAYEVGPGDLATPLSVVNYFQEAAGVHARALGIERFDLGEAGAAWVLARLAVSFGRLPRWRESVTVETWPSGRDGLRATRDLLLKDADDAILARARTVWFVLDLARRRPARLPPAVLDIEPPDRDDALALESSPTPPADPDSSRTFDLRRSDLDRNEHANNARFVDWALEAVDRAPARLVSVDIAFKEEAVFGDTVVSEAGAVGTRAVGTGAVSHAIFRQSDRHLLATARTRWT